jgi:hypothetical protein
MAIRKPKPSRSTNVRKPSKAASGNPKDCESKRFAAHTIIKDAGPISNWRRQIVINLAGSAGKRRAEDLYKIAATHPGNSRGRADLIEQIGILLVEQAAEEVSSFCKGELEPFLEDAFAALGSEFEEWAYTLFRAVPVYYDAVCRSDVILNEGIDRALKSRDRAQDAALAAGFDIIDDSIPF